MLCWLMFSVDTDVVVVAVADSVAVANASVVCIDTNVALLTVTG